MKRFIKSSSFILIFSSLALFLITLQSFYFYKYNIAPFPLLGILIFVFISYNKSSTKDAYNFIVILFFFFIFSITWANINRLDYIYINSIIGIFLGLFVFIIIVKHVHYYDKNFIIQLLNNVILFHLIFFTFQFLNYYIAGRLIDYLLPITGEESRFFFGGAISGLVRCTGLFNEPATYSYYVGALVFLKILVQKKIDLFAVFGLLSLTFTLSISGILLTTLILIYYILFIKNSYKNFIIFITIVIFFLLILILFFENTIYIYLFERLTNISDDNSTNIRFFDSFIFLKTKSIFIQLFGVGIGNYTNATSLTTSGIVALISSFGFVGYIFFTYLLYFFTKKNGVINFFMFNLFLFSTITIQVPFFWFLFSIYYYNAKANC
jgi:hypothetical protein